MAEVLPDAPQDFWSPPSALDSTPQADMSVASPHRHMAETCERCSSEFMIGSKFCHSCGSRRAPGPILVTGGPADPHAISGVWRRNMAKARSGANLIAVSWRSIPFPAWLRYLHFHEIKKGVGLPTAALIAFIVGIGCLAGAVGVSFFYRASNLAEFQAIQMWRIQWLLAATASFVAGILLKKPSDIDSDDSD